MIPSFERFQKTQTPWALSRRGLSDSHSMLEPTHTFCSYMKRLPALIKWEITLKCELGLELDILVVGGTVDPKLQSDYSSQRH